MKTLKPLRPLSYAEHLFAVHAQLDLAERNLEAHVLGQVQECLAHARCHLALAEGRCSRKTLSCRRTRR